MAPEHLIMNAFGARTGKCRFRPSTWPRSRLPRLSPCGALNRTSMMLPCILPSTLAADGYMVFWRQNSGGDIRS